MVGDNRTESFDVSEAVQQLNDDESDADTSDTETDVSSVAEALDGSFGPVVDDIWPAPDYYPHQRQAVIDVLEALYEDGHDVVQLSAPTGAGKSLIIYGVTKVINRLADKESFITTPLNSLIDQIENDDFINDVVSIKGRNNYKCIHKYDKGAPVDEAICQRESDFECEHKDTLDTNGGCPYYGRRERAQDDSIALTNLPYLMANSMIPETEDARFEQRDFLAVDETQNIESFALNFIGFTIDRRAIPINFNEVPPMPPEGCSMDEIVDWISYVLAEIVDRINRLNEKSSLTREESTDRDDLQELRHKMTNFLQDFAENNHWTKTRDGQTIVFEPVFVGRFINQFLWQQTDKILLSSATIPKGSFLESIGLDDRDVATVDVPSTYDTKRRPVVTRETVGKMSKGERDTTIPKMAQTLADIADFHEGQKGFVHCHSYKIMERLYESLPDPVQRRTMCQDRDNRTESMEIWFDRPEQIFLSVSMDEGISLDDELARWQVVAKAAYPFMGDKRVSYRVNELNDWDWYAGQAAISLQQAAGRAMRSQDDWAITYVLDSSAAALIDNNSHLFEDWFLDAVDCHTDRDVFGAPNISFDL